MAHGRRSKRRGISRNALADLGEGDIETVAKRFKRAPRKTVGDILESLAALGHVRQIGTNRFAA